jgi:cupin 2 domain-containing protein
MRSLAEPRFDILRRNLGRFPGFLQQSLTFGEGDFVLNAVSVRIGGGMSDTVAGNIFAGAAAGARDEILTTLLRAPGLRIERIVSTGQASPPGFWYDQAHGEWVLLLAGAAALELEHETAPRRLGPGDYLWLPPRRRHRVAWTDPAGVTIWLAVQVGEAEG